MAVAKVGNLCSAIEELKKKGVWINGAEAGGKAVYETDMKGACAVVWVAKEREFPVWLRNIVIL